MSDPLDSGNAFFGAATSSITTGIAGAIITFFLGAPWCDETSVSRLPEYLPSGCGLQNFDRSCITRYSPPTVCDNAFGFPPIANSTEVATLFGLVAGLVGGIAVFIAASRKQKGS